MKKTLIAIVSVLLVLAASVFVYQITNAPPDCWNSSESAAHRYLAGATEDTKRTNPGLCHDR